MSCTLMYQPYAMSYSSSSSCDRTTSAAERQKVFKFPPQIHPESPPDSSASSAGGSPSSSSTYAPANFTLPLIPPGGSGPSTGPFNYHHSHHHHLNHHPHLSLGHQNQNQQLQHHQHHQLPLSPHETSPTSQRSSSSSHSRRSLTPCATVTSADQQQDQQQQQQQHHEESTSSRSSDLDLPHTITSASLASSSTSQHTRHQNTQQGHAQGATTSSATPSSSSSSRAQYLSANCIVYENYVGDSAREVDEHFSKALSVAYGSNGGSGLAEKSGSGGKNLPMSTRNFPPSFWDSAYQPPPVPSTSSRPPLSSYGHTDFYGSAAASMDYTNGLPVPGLHHHPQSDPWHYPLAPHHHHHHHHQSYHHHHRDLAAAAAYPAMPSSSRFNPAQYSSFLFPSAASAASASRAFPGIGASSVGGVKGDSGHWGAGGRYHPHPHHESSWSDFHLADYSAAAAHYSNITAAGGNF